MPKPCGTLHACTPLACWPTKVPVAAWWLQLPASQAAPCYELVRSNLAIALTDLATLRKAAGDAVAGIALYERALALAPRHADALYNLGVALAEPGPHQALDRALFYYQAAAAVRPDCAEA